MLFASTSAAESALHSRWRWQHFSIAELCCKCDGRYCDRAYWHDSGFLDALTSVRADIGGPLIVTSGHRCPKWNRRVGGAVASKHLQIAVDVAVASHSRSALLRSAQQRGFSGIGLAAHFIHLDRRADPALWIYNGSEHLWTV